MDFNQYMMNPMTQLGLSMLSQWKTPGGQPAGSLSGAMDRFQQMQQQAQMQQMRQMQIDQIKKQIEKEKRLEELYTKLPTMYSKYTTPAIQGSLEQNKLGPGLDIESQQGKQLLEQELGGQTTQQPDLGTLSKALQRINTGANYVQQGTPNELPLESRPASFDRSGFQREAMPIVMQLAPEVAAKQVMGNLFPEPEEYGTSPVLTEEGEYVQFGKSGGVKKSGVKGKSKEGSQSSLAQLLEEQKKYPEGSATWKYYQQRIDKETTHAPAPSATAIANAGDKGLSEYWKTMGGAKAKTLAEAETRAEGAVKNIYALDRFISASERGTAGGAQPIISGVQNFLSSFGYTSDELTSVAKMQSAISGVLANYMQSLGARGLTDSDMKILKENLPRVETSREARVAVAKILRKSYKKEVENYGKEQQRAYENAPPEMRNMMQPPAWYEDYKTGSGGWKDL